MESVANVKVSFPNSCGFCGNAGISKCGRCFSMYYCCKEHQRQHWPMHKKTCKKSTNSGQVSINTNQLSPEKRTLGTNFNEPKIHSPGRNLNEIEKCSPGRNLNETEKCSPGRNPNETEKSSPSNINVTEKRSPSNLNVTKDLIISNLKDTCMKVISSLNSAGICVLDHFMGTEYGHRILLEVTDLYKKRTFEKGRLIGKPNVTIESVRSDVMTWVTGREPECTNILCLMRKIDEMVDAINKMPDRGVLSEYKLFSRTQIMIACYPGNGTHYQKHVDNPDKDGRRITFVYYLNHNWHKEQGGVLRAYPSSSSQSLDVEPLFDRLVIFWSDRRVPHEVLPAYANRFAITVWYFDYNERNAFKQGLS